MHTPSHPKAPRHLPTGGSKPGGVAQFRALSNRRDQFEGLMKKYQGARKSELIGDKTKFINRDVQEFLTSAQPATPVLFDLLTSLSYLHTDGQGRFDAELTEDPMGLTPDAHVTPIQAEYVSDFRQTLGPKELAALPKDVLPAPGGQILKLLTPEGSKTCVVFTGTNSVGPNRDPTLTHEHATGALANGNPHGVGAGVIQHWLSQVGHPLRAYWNEADIFVGHSLGAALAQEAMLQKLSDTDPETYPNLMGYFASAPSLSRPPSPVWNQVQNRMFYTGSQQDPVRLAGTFQYPGMSLISGVGDLPISTGFGDSLMDGLVTQHGAPVPSLLWARGDELQFTPQLGTQLGEPTDESLPIDQLFWEAADALRPSVTPSLFHGTSIEQVMHDFQTFGIDKLFPGGPDNTRGIEYGYAVHLVHRLLGSELIAAAYVANPEATLRAIQASGQQLFDDPEIGLKDLVERLPLRSVITNPKNDLVKVLLDLRVLNAEVKSK